MPSVTLEEAKEKIKQVLPYLRVAVEDAAKKGRPQLGVLAVNDDGSGTVVCQLEAPEFFEDLALVIGVGPLTKEQRLEAGAQWIFDLFGGGKS